jgi:hypothetical protein
MGFASTQPARSRHLPRRRSPDKETPMTQPGQIELRLEDELAEIEREIENETKS